MMVVVRHALFTDLQVQIENAEPLSADQVIQRSGFMPRDGSQVFCFDETGTLIKSAIDPSQEVYVGCEPPKEIVKPRKRITKKRKKPFSPRRHQLTLDHSKKGARGRSFSSGRLTDGTIVFVPGNLIGEHTIVQTGRFKNRNDVEQIQGYILPEGDTYPVGSLVIIQSRGKHAFRCVNPGNGRLTTRVDILPESLAQIKSEVDEHGERARWCVKVIEHDPLNNRIKGSVQIARTWWNVKK